MQFPTSPLTQTRSPVTRSTTPACSTAGSPQYGGTSFVSPQLNGATAVIDSYVGHRVGFWNPQIYRFASSLNSPFTPLNDTTAYQGKQYLYQTDANGHVTALPGEFSNNNEYFTGNPGDDLEPGVRPRHPRPHRAGEEVRSLTRSNSLLASRRLDRTITHFVR